MGLKRGSEIDKSKMFLCSHLPLRVVTAKIIHLQRQLLPPHVNISTLGNVESDLQQEGEIDVDKTRLRSTKIHGLHYASRGEKKKDVIVMGR